MAPRVAQKSTGQCRGFLLLNLGRRSVPHGATPVKAIDQRRADGLYPRLEGNCGSWQCGPDLRKRDAIIEGRAVLRLHKPPRRRNAKVVQAVFKTAANEPAITSE